MTNKPKSVAQGLFADILLFARRFYHETPLDTVTVVQRLMLLDEEWGWFQIYRKAAEVVRVSDDHFRFDLRIKQCNGSIIWTIMKAVGEVRYDPVLSTAVVDGKIMLGVWWYAWAWMVIFILFGIAILVEDPPFAAWITAGAGILFAVYSVYTLARTRSTLREALEAIAPVPVEIKSKVKH